MRIVESANELREIAQQASTADKIYLDLETTHLDPYTSRILLIAMRFNGETYIIDLSKIEKSAIECLKVPLESRKSTKVLHNAVFDYKFLFHHFGISIYPIHCTYVTEQLIQAGLRGVYCSLEAVALRRLGLQMNKTVREGFIGRDQSVGITNEEYNYAAQDVDVLEDIMRQQLEEIAFEELTRVYSLEMELLPVTAGMEYTGIDIDENKVEEAIPLFQGLVDKANADIQDSVISNGLATEIVFSRDGYKAINTASQPQMLRVLHAMGVPVESLSVKELTAWDSSWAEGQKKYNKVVELADLVGADDEEDDELNIGFSHPFLRKHAIRTAASKILNTYLIGVKNTINPVTKRIHPSFRQCGAMATGRYSSSEPNFQNLPNSGKIKNLGLANYDIRSMFIAGPGNMFIISDYSAIELVILAALSQDPVLLHQISEGDIHSFVGNNIFGTNFTKDMAEEEPYKTYRHTAKTLTYAIMYGTGGRNLYRTLSLPLATCGFHMSPDMGDAWIAQWKSMFPDTGRLLDENSRKAVTDLYTQSVLGRRRHWNYDMLRDKWMMYRAMREGTNAVIQSSSADMTKLAMLLVNPELDPREAQLVATIHDELLTRCRTELVDKYIPIIKWGMEEAGRRLFPDLPAGYISVKPKFSSCYDK